MMDKFAARKGLQLGDACLSKILEYSSQFDTVLDVGGAEGRHALKFADAGKKVTLVDINPECPEHENIKIIEGEFEEYAADLSADLVWCSHILEHQRDVGIFLEDVLLSAEKFIAITVPPAKHQIVGGHLTIWNAGLLLYNLVLAGQDCRHAKILETGYNISLIVKKKVADFDNNKLQYDHGDIEYLKEFFPKELEWWNDSFYGDIKELNWWS